MVIHIDLGLKSVPFFCASEAEKFATAPKLPYHCCITAITNVKWINFPELFKCACKLIILKNSNVSWSSKSYMIQTPMWGHYKLPLAAVYDIIQWVQRTMSGYCLNLQVIHFFLTFLSFMWGTVVWLWQLTRTIVHGKGLITSDRGTWRVLESGFVWWFSGLNFIWFMVGYCPARMEKIRGSTNQI